MRSTYAVASGTLVGSESPTNQAFGNELIVSFPPRSHWLAAQSHQTTEIKTIRKLLDYSLVILHVHFPRNIARVVLSMESGAGPGKKKPHNVRIGSKKKLAVPQ